MSRLSMINATTLAALTLPFALGLNVAPAQAQLARTHVSAVNGSDGNNCDRAAPCRSFQKGHDTVAAGGEITRPTARRPQPSH